MTYRLVRVRRTEIANPGARNEDERHKDSYILNHLAEQGWRLVAIAVDPATRGVIAAMEHDDPNAPFETPPDISYTEDD